MAQLLVYLFPAILPPQDTVDFEYYDVLGIPKKSSLAMIKSAYKKQSLRYHPDKTNAVEAAAIYERIQEAHNVLKDDEKRNLYHNLGCSVGRFRCLENGDLLNPVMIHQNILRASWIDKSRLVIVAVLLIGIVLLQPVILAVKLNGDSLQNTSWRLCFIPLFVLQGLHWIMRLCLVWWDHDVLGLLETTGWYISTLLLFAYQLDASDKLDYRLVAIPFFVSMFFRVLSYIVKLRSIRIAQSNMVSEQYVAEVLHPNGAADETTEDEENPDYIMVHADEPSVVAAMGLMDRPPSREEIEALRVQTSAEFQAAEEAASVIRQDTTRWIVIFVPLAILITLKLSGKIRTATWWIIFLPMWIMLFVRMCRNLFVCLCLVPPGVLEEPEPEISTDDHNVPTSHYFKAPESEMSVFAEWDGDQLTSDRIAKVRTDEMGMAEMEEGGKQEETSGDSNQVKVENAQATTASGNNNNTTASHSNVSDHGETNPNEEPNPIERRDDDNGDKDDDDEDGAYEPMEEDEADYVQAKFQACSATCSLCLELIILCLVVGLIQDPGAYNAFWVLFPVFLVSAVLLVCVCCCVYAKELPSMPDFEDADEENQASDVDQPEVSSSEKATATPETGNPADVAIASDSPANKDNAGDDDKEATEHSAMDELD